MAVLKEEYTKSSIILKNFIMITLGTVIFAYSLESLIVPNNIIDGGVVGLSLIFEEISQIPFSIAFVMLNLPFLFLGYKYFGQNFTSQSLYGIVLASILTELFSNVSPISDEPLLSSIFGGIFLGIGVGLVLRNNSAIDGTEILATLIGSRSGLSVGQIIMGLNLVIFSLAGFVFGIESTFYSIVCYYIAYKVIDIVLEGMNESRQVFIISNQFQEIGDAICSNLGRTVTYLSGEGGYSGEQKKVIYCVISRLEEAKLKNLVHQFDPEAFLATAKVSDVRGGVFAKKNLERYF